MSAFPVPVKARRSKNRIFVRAVVVLLALCVAGLLAIGWQASTKAIHPAAARHRGLDQFPALHAAQGVTIHSRTGADLAATFFAGSKRAAVILSHGYGDNQNQMLPYAEFLNRDGFSVLIYDMRNRGRSTGDAVTLGALEQTDLISAVDYITSRPEIDTNRIGALGVSLGGSATLLAAAADPRIKAVVDDSGFSDAPNVIETSFEHFIGLPAFPFAPITVQMVRLRTGIDANTIRPMDVAGRISPRPLLVIHCMEDKVVPPDNSDRNFAAAREPKQFWRVPSGGHIAAFKVARDEYERRVTRFFEDNLLSKN